MYLWNVLKVLFCYDFGFPSNVLLPVFFAAAVVIQVLCLHKVSGGKRWFPAAVFAAVLVICEVCLHFIKTYTALLVFIVLFYAVVALLGTLLGILLYKLRTKVRHS